MWTYFGFLLLFFLPLIDSKEEYDMFTSSTKCYMLHDELTKLINKLNICIAEEENRLQKLKQWVNNYQMMAVNAKKDFVENPLQRDNDQENDDKDVTQLKERLKARQRYYSKLQVVPYEKLCRGEEFVAQSIRDKLVCRYSPGHHPYLIIGPVKEEEVYLQPRIVIYHDFVSDKQIKTIHELARPLLKPSTVADNSTATATANYRVSMTAWLHKSWHTDVAAIYKRTHELTGLNMDSAEDMGVNNYGIGGWYTSHFDFLKMNNDRIATMLIYETNVEQGGATVFPHLGISISPKKGSAAFWFNLLQNGKGDEMTMHAACPVLSGTKWVSNIWIHERGQEKNRPCSTNPFV